MGWNASLAESVEAELNTAGTRSCWAELVRTAQLSVALVLMDEDYIVVIDREWVDIPGALDEDGVVAIAAVDLIRWVLDRYDEGHD